jgi:hypothetical protein
LPHLVGRIYQHLLAVDLAKKVADGGIVVGAHLCVSVVTLPVQASR